MLILIADEARNQSRDGESQNQPLGDEPGVSHEKI